MRGLRNILFIFAIAILLPCKVAGQDMVGKISGYVVDSIYEEPCAYAILTLENINKITYSDTSGYFAFDSIPLGKYTLTVKYLGYYDSEIEISTDTIYDELTIMLSPSIWGNTERDSIIVYTYRTDDPFSSPVTKLIPNPYRKVNVPRLIVKNKNFESALDTIIAHIGSKSNKKYYLLKIDKNKFITIYSLNTPINLNCVPNGVLKYNGRTFYVLGDYKYILKSEEKCGQENNETLIFEFSEEETNTIIGTLNIQNGAWK